MRYHGIDLLLQLQIPPLRSPGPNQNPRGTYIWDTPPSQKWTKIQHEFRPNHLGRRKSWLPQNDTHAYRVSPHCAGRSIHTITKSGRLCPKSIRHGLLDRKCGRYVSYNKETLPRDPPAQTNHHPENHRRCKHQITCRPSQSRHRKNHVTRPDHPRFPVQ